MACPLFLFPPSTSPPWDQKLKQGSGRTYMDAPEVDGTVLVRTPTKGISVVCPRPGEFMEVLIQETQEYDLVGVATPISLA